MPNAMNIFYFLSCYHCALYKEAIFFPNDTRYCFTERVLTISALNVFKMDLDLRLAKRCCWDKLHMT